MSLEKTRIERTADPSGEVANALPYYRDGQNNFLSRHGDSSAFSSSILVFVSVGPAYTLLCRRILWSNKNSYYPMSIHKAEQKVQSVLFGLAISQRVPDML